MQATTELKTQLNKNLEELKTLRDEVRVRAHLFSMELKDAWNELEPRLARAERKAQKATEASAAALGGALEALIAFQARTKQ